MWLFTKTFFCSTVEDKNDSNKLLVRFRSRKHASAFCNKYDLDKTTVVENGGDDYLFRMFLSRKKFLSIIMAEGKDIDYGNFKDAVHAKNRRLDSEKRHFHQDEEDKALYRVWNAMVDYQMLEEVKGEK